MVWPVGLQNLGNTCFLNSVLQALTYSDVLFEAVEESSHQHSCASKRNGAQSKSFTSYVSSGNPGQLRNSSDVEGVLAVDGRGTTSRTENCVLCALERHIKLARQLSSEKEKYMSSRNSSHSNNQSMSGRTDTSSFSLNNSRDNVYTHNDGRNENMRILSPSEIVELLPVLSSSLRKGRQEDAHECLNALITSSAICCGDFINCRSALNVHNNIKNNSDRNNENNIDDNGSKEMRGGRIDHNDVYDSHSNTHITGNSSGNNNNNNNDDDNKTDNSNIVGNSNSNINQNQNQAERKKNGDKNGKSYNQSELDVLYGNSDFIKDYLTSGVKLDKSKISRNIADLTFIPFLHTDNENHNTVNNNGKNENTTSITNTNSSHNITKNHQSGAKTVKCSKKDSYFTDLFRGSVVNTVRCSTCRTQSAHLEPVLGLQLDVARASTVRSALGECFGSETLYGQNAYDCEICKTKTIAEKKASMRNVPSVLAVQLKRFSLENFESNELSKIKHFVEYPKILDLEPFLSEVEKKVENESEEEHYLKIVNRKKEAELELCGVVVHLGSTLSNGHYVAYVRCKSDKKGVTDTWYRTDDTVVTVCTEVEALSQKDAYLLLFENKKTKIKNPSNGNSNSTRFPVLRFPTAFSCPITGKRNRYELENNENERTERTVNKNGNNNNRRVGVGAIKINKNEIKIMEQCKTLDDVPIYNVYDQNTHEYDNAHSVYQSANSHLERHRDSDDSDLNERGKFKILYRATSTDNDDNNNNYDNDDFNNHNNNTYKNNYSNTYKSIYNNNNNNKVIADNKIQNHYQNKNKEKEKDKRIMKVREESYKTNTVKNTEKENENENEKRKRQLDENSENRIENEEKKKKQKSNNSTALRSSVLTQSFIYSKLITLGKLTKLGAENVLKSVKKIIFEPDEPDV